MTIKQIAITALATVALGCGGPGSFNGAVDGKTMRVNDAIFMLSGGKPTGQISLSEAEDHCAEVNARMESLPSFLMSVRRQGQPAGLETGTYLIMTDSAARQNAPAPGPLFAWVWFLGDHVDTTGQDGTIRVDTASPEAVSGAFDLTLLTGDHVTGTFNARPCELN